jgi:hypothetical protein
MKINHLLIGLIAIFLISGCNVGVKKDLISGLKVANNGLALEDAYLSVNGQKTSASEFSLKTEVDFIATGVKGFIEKDSMAYIGASMTIIDKNNKEIMSYPDLFASYDSTGVNPADAEQVTVMLTVGNPMVVGETYLWKTRIWDKNGKGEITSEMKITVK